jgi:hypothetical protein
MSWIIHHDITSPVFVDKTITNSLSSNHVLMGSLSGAASLNNGLTITHVINPVIIRDAGSLEDNQNYVTDFEKTNIENIPNETWRLSNALSTFLLEGGLISINSDALSLNITKGTGIIVDNIADTLHPTRKIITWPDFYELETPFLTISSNTFIGVQEKVVDEFGYNGQIVFSQDSFEPSEQLSIIVLGWADHNDLASIGQALTEPNFGVDLALQFLTFIDSFGSFNINGNIFSPNGTNLYINRSEGKTYDGGSNYINDRHQPNIVTLATELNVSFQYYYRINNNDTWVNNAEVSNLIDPNNYDFGAGLLPVPQDKWTIQLFYLYAPNDWNDIVYGQVVYENYSEAFSALNNTTKFNEYLKWDTFRGWLIVKQGAVNLSDPAQAVFIIPKGNVGSSGTSGGGSGEVNTASNLISNGVGLFESKSGVDLRFKRVNSLNTLIRVIDNTVDKRLDIQLGITTGASPPSNPVAGDIWIIPSN